MLWEQCQLTFLCVCNLVSERNSAIKEECVTRADAGRCSTSVSTRSSTRGSRSSSSPHAFCLWLLCLCFCCVSCSTRCCRHALLLLSACACRATAAAPPPLPLTTPASRPLASTPTPATHVLLWCCCCGCTKSCEPRHRCACTRVAVVLPDDRCDRALHLQPLCAVCRARVAPGPRPRAPRRVHRAHAERQQRQRHAKRRLPRCTLPLRLLCPRTTTTNRSSSSSRCSRGTFALCVVCATTRTE